MRLFRAAVTADTGVTALPVTIAVCEIDATTAACITPRGASTSGVWSQNQNRFFAAFVRDTSAGAGIPLDAANSRVYLRFTDATGSLRSVTSVAVTAPTASDGGRPLPAFQPAAGVF